MAKEGQAYGGRASAVSGQCNLQYLSAGCFWMVSVFGISRRAAGSEGLGESCGNLFESEGIRLQTTHRVFKGYLPEEHIGRTIEQENLLILLEHCTNLRDRVLLLLLAETGFRIDEMLGIRYTQDIDYQSRCLKVRFRENNANGARAKNAEYRRAKISAETFEVLMCYLAEHREILKNTEYLFVNLSGAYLGEPLGVNGVYAMLRRLEKKTGIKATPHMLRHYFANERRKAGWDLLLISKALGHRKIATTEKYLDVGSEELVAATDLYFQNHKNLYAIDQLL